MPFLVPFIAPMILGGGTAAAGYLANRKTSEEKLAYSAQARLSELEALAASRGFERSKDIAPFTDRFLTQGVQGTGDAMGYWGKILSGRESASSLLAPEINQINTSYDAARTASRTLNPRGGGASAFTRQIDEGVRPGQISGLLATARPRAASELGVLGVNSTSLGTNLASVETGLLRGVSPGASANLLDYGLRNRGQQFDMGSSVGGSIFDIFKMFQKGGGTQTTGSGTSPGPSSSSNPYRREGNSWGLY